MKIDKDTVVFIGILNELADRMLDEVRGVFVPFSVLGGMLMECCRNSVYPAGEAVFYDDSIEKKVERGGCEFYPVVHQIEFGDFGCRIVKNFDKVFVCVEQTKDGGTGDISLFAIMDDSLEEMFASDSPVVVISKGFWYVS